MVQDPCEDQYVFKSLTDTQKDIIKLVAKAHLDNPDDKGIKMKDLFAICVDEMLLHNQKALKEYLLEAKDHKIIHEKTDENGFLVLYMKYPNHLLEKIVGDELG